MAYTKVSGKTPRFMVKDFPVEFEKNGQYIDESISIRYRHSLAFANVGGGSADDIRVMNDALKEIFKVTDADIVDFGELFEIVVQVMEQIDGNTPR